MRFWEVPSLGFGGFVRMLRGSGGGVISRLCRALGRQVSLGKRKP